MPAFANLDQVTITGTFITFRGAAPLGKVTFTPAVTLIDSAANQIVVPQPITVDLDSLGSFAVTLPATDDPDLAPTGWTYAVEEAIVAGGQLDTRKYLISVPKDTPVNPATGRREIDLADIVPAVPAPAVVTYVLVAHLSDPTAHAAVIAAHKAANDPHPEYLTPLEGNALYAPLGTGGPPTGGAGGVLSGNYPNPGFAVDMATQSELNTEITDRTSADALLIPLTQKAAPSGVATLDSAGKVPAGQLPAGTGSTTTATSFATLVRMGSD